MTLGAAGNEMEDYPIDEEKVMSGNDDKIAPAVSAAVEMGFDPDLATQAAKELIIQYPGRGDVTELVVETLLMGAGGGARAFPMPAQMPEAYAAGAERAEARAAAAAPDGPIDLTDDSPPRTEGAKRRRSEGRNDVVTIDDDDDDEGGDAGSPGTMPASSSLGAGGGGASSLMAELARERMERERNRGGAPAPDGPYAAKPRSTAKERYVPSTDKGPAGNLTGAAKRVAGLAPSSQGGGGVGGLGILDALLAGNEPIKTPLAEVRLLTYNVWFAEHVALVDRMDGLTDIIMREDPHVICLQEVTHNILMLLHAQPWFEDYKGSPPPQQQYYTLILFKRSMNKPDNSTRVSRRDFMTSEMGRYAVGFCGMNCGDGKELTVFTSHLESFISKEHTSSDERVRQMKDALRVIDAVTERRAGEYPGVKTRNGIFMGDTNWDETTDGDVPLPEGWEDAWLTHGDGSKGYTYDLRRNPMMGGWLQKRLDRVLYNLTDFTVAGIKMVGTEPVTRKDGSVVTYVNEYRGRSETKPVLPSDHFGLMVTLKPK